VAAAEVAGAGEYTDEISQSETNYQLKAIYTRFFSVFFSSFDVTDFVCTVMPVGVNGLGLTRVCLTYC